MDVLKLLLTATNVIVKIIPPPKPPRVDYTPLYELFKVTPELPKATVIDITPAPVALLEQPKERVEEGEQLTPVTETGAPVATSCIACSRSHMATIAGALDESLRFAREGGIMDPEAIRRIDTAEKEINILERIDLSPEAIQNSPKKDQDLAHYFLPKIRKLRQDIGQTTSVEALERAAADASVLTHEFRLKQMESSGVNLNPILELAKKVQAGEITLEDARAKVKEYLPAEA